MLGVASAINPNRRSAHYAKQSKFSGSDREIRGKIVRLMLAHKKMRTGDIARAIPRSQGRIIKVLGALSREGFIKKKGDTVTL